MTIETINVMDVFKKSVNLLLQFQHRQGCWIDFSIHGSSDQWITGYAALSLSEAMSVASSISGEIKEALHKAHDYLIENRHPCGGWGYNADVQPDADSTSIVTRFFDHAGYDIPSGTIGFLKRHGDPQLGYATYLRDSSQDRWGKPVPEITAAVASVLYDVGVLQKRDLKALWSRYLEWRQRQCGDWAGFWWTNNGYPTLSVCELLLRCDEPLPKPFLHSKRDVGQFETACFLHASVLCQKTDAKDFLLLLCNNLIDENNQLSIRPSAYLQAPANKFLAHNSDEYSIDNHGVFTLSQVIRALSAYIVAFPDCKNIKAQSVQQRRQALNRNRLAANIPCKRAAENINIVMARALAMNKDPLCSILADGIPVEFSVRLHEEQPKMRFACEIDNNGQDSVSRFHGQQEELSNIANFLGVADTWHAFTPFLKELAYGCKYVKDSRFLSWTGFETNPKNGNEFKFKAYYNAQLLKDEGGVNNALDLLLKHGLCQKVQNRDDSDILSFLSLHGTLQEFGIGINESGKYGFKFYWEFSGWDNEVLNEVLERLSLSSFQEKCKPFVSWKRSMVSIEEARHLPFGLALRITPNGQILKELTIAYKLPVRTISASNNADRIREFCRHRNGNVEAYGAFQKLFKHKGFTPSLMTTAVNEIGVSDTIYLRPDMMSDVKNALRPHKERIAC